MKSNSMLARIAVFVVLAGAAAQVSAQGAAQAPVAPAKKEAAAPPVSPAKKELVKKAPSCSRPASRAWASAWRTRRPGRSTPPKAAPATEDEGFEIRQMKLVHLSKEQAKGFYIVHKDKKFYDSLTDFMSSGEIVVMMLERENAISHWREVMGATDPAMAKPGTLRHALGFSVERNAVHGSDARATAEWEISYFSKK